MSFPSIMGDFLALPRYLTRLDPGIVWSVAMLAAMGYAVRSARRSGLSPQAMYWAAVSATIFGFFGAHLLSLLVHGWQGGPLAILGFWQGGKSLFGGLLLGGLAAGLYFHFRKLAVLAYADAAMPALALGYAIGRIGCFLNGDDFGIVSHGRWAVMYPPRTEAYQAHLARGWIAPEDAWSLPVHPVQLYAAALGLVLFLILASWRSEQSGDKFCFYLVAYGVGRFALEYLRGDFHAVLGPFSLPQLFSIGFMAFGAGLWFRILDRRKHASVTTEISPEEPLQMLTQQQVERYCSAFDGPA